MRIGEHFGTRGKRVLWAMGAGIVVFVILLGLAGPSPLMTGTGPSPLTTGPLQVAGVLSAAIGYFEGVGLMYLVHLYLSAGRRGTAGGRLTLGWIVGLASISALGYATFGYLFIVARTVPGAFIMGLGFGLFIGAGRNVIKALRQPS